MEAALLELLQQAKEAGSSASLSFTTVGGTTKAKFEIELPSTGASPTPTATSSVPGGERRHRRRRRHRGPAAVAKRKARAVAHQASLAMPPPPPPPPPPASTQRFIEVVQRKPGSRSSFSQLDGESGGEVDSEEDGVPPPPSLVCASNCGTVDQHCWNCGRCFGLCPEHSGCTCEPEEEEEIESLSSICHCFLTVCYPDESRKYPYMTGLSDSHPNISVITYR